MSSYKDPKVIMGFIAILIVVGLAWNYTETLKQRNEIERERIASEERIKQATIQEDKRASAVKLQADKEAALLKSEKEAAEAQERKIAEQKKIDFDMNAKCAKDAETVYYKEYNDGNDTFSSHFNKRLNKCYMLVSSVGSLFTSRQLKDVHEKNLVGLCNQSRTTGEVQVCSVAGKTCTDYDDCWERMKPYMND